MTVFARSISGAKSISIQGMFVTTSKANVLVVTSKEHRGSLPHKALDDGLDANNARSGQ